MSRPFLVVSLAVLFFGMVATIIVGAVIVQKRPQVETAAKPPTKKPRPVEQKKHVVIETVPVKKKESPPPEPEPVVIAEAPKIVEAPKSAREQFTDAVQAFIVEAEDYVQKVNGYSAKQLEDHARRVMARGYAIPGPSAELPTIGNPEINRMRMWAYGLADQAGEHIEILSRFGNVAMARSLAALTRNQLALFKETWGRMQK